MTIVTGLTVADELDAFVVTHAGHGPAPRRLRAGGRRGLHGLGDVRRGRGASWVRWVTRAVVEAERDEP